MTTHAEVAARLVDAGLDTDTAEQVATELAPPDPPPAGHVAREGTNPDPTDPTEADMRAYALKLFKLDP
jgi:hypothetical protein